MQKHTYKKQLLIFTVVLGALVLSAGVERNTLPETTSVMRAQALTYGKEQEKVTPPKPFVYDGCTFFLDTVLTSDLQHACLVHDIAYWYGGSAEERKSADIKLRYDVEQSGGVGQVLAYPVYAGVRVFGDSILTKSVNANWGFGWN